MRDACARLRRRMEVSRVSPSLGAGLPDKGEMPRASMARSLRTRQPRGNRRLNARKGFELLLRGEPPPLIRGKGLFFILSLAYSRFKSSFRFSQNCRMASWRNLERIVLTNLYFVFSITISVKVPQIAFSIFFFIVCTFRYLSALSSNHLSMPEEPMIALSDLSSFE